MKDSDKRTRCINQDIHARDLVTIDPEMTGGKKLGNYAIGTFKLLARDQRKFKSNKEQWWRGSTETV